MQTICNLLYLPAIREKDEREFLAPAPAVRGLGYCRIGTINQCGLFEYVYLRTREPVELNGHALRFFGEYRTGIWVNTNTLEFFQRSILIIENHSAHFLIYA
jgi:hypothetical protein